MSSSFVHLHVHTAYSILDGACHLDDIVDAAVADDMKAVAITDHGVMYGVVDFWQKARRRGIRPIIGCEVNVVTGSRFDRPGAGQKETHHHLVLLAETDLGYHNLIRLVTASHVEGFHHKPRIDKDLLNRHHRGLIALSGCWSGEVGRHVLAERPEDALRAAGEYAELLGKNSFFLEVQNHGTDEDRKACAGVLSLAARLGVGVVATNDVHYLKKEHAAAHDVLLCIQTQAVLGDRQRIRFPAPEFHFKNSEEMEALFRETPQAIRTTLDIADRCDVELRFGEVHFPAFRHPDGRDPRAVLAGLCRSGVKERYGVADVDRPRDEREREIAERLNRELHVIEKTGFVNYFLVVWDFVRFARTRDIPVGLRGSGGASLAAYAIGITDIDPLRYSLIFERFLNPERVSPPDFDIDFCQVRRGEVIDYLKTKYGRESVAQIVTFGSFGLRNAIRDIGRVLAVPHPECDRLAGMAPDDPAITVKDALAKSAAVRNEQAKNKVFAEILDHARIIQGLYRTPGTHAAGVVMAERPLVEIVPLARYKEGELITQYSMEPLARIGLLKMDLLGLRTLTVIHDTLRSIRETRGQNVALDCIPENDRATFDLLNRGDTVGVFQLESGGMRELIRRVGIDCIEDLIAIIALYRPGPMNMLDEYVNRKTGKSPVTADHPLLEPVVRETYGVMIYQEQVQQAASVLAGYSLAQGDVLRRAMSKKDPSSMEEQRSHFVEGCRKAHGISRHVAERIFGTLAGFAAYGFNKSHSAAYAVVTYRTAYLKANFPAEFMSALLSSEVGNAERLRLYIKEARKMGLEVRQPDINDGTARFQPVGQTIRFGLAGIRNVGEAAVAAIVSEREKNGAYRGMVDFCVRVGSHHVSKRLIETLVRCGCFDSLGTHRARLFNAAERALALAASVRPDRLSGQGDLFRAVESTPSDGGCLPECEPWHENELLAGEKELLGFYVSGHPLSNYASLIERYQLSELSRMDALSDGTVVRAGGIVAAIEAGNAADGREMAEVELDGLTGWVKVLVPPDVYQRCGGYLRHHEAIFVCGRVKAERPARLQALEICRLADVPAHLTERISVHLTTSHLSQGVLDGVRRILGNHPGPVPVVICLEFPSGGKVFVDAHKSYRVIPNDGLIQELESLLGEESVYVAPRARIVVDAGDCL